MNDREKISEFKYYDEELNDWIENKELDDVLNEIASFIGWIYD